MANLKGIYVAEALGGFILVWSGIKGQTLKVTLTDLLKGQNPAKVTEAAPSIGVSDAGSPTASASGGGNAPAAPANVSGNVATGKMMAAARGWTGGQWNALYALWQRESGWSNTAQNPSSGAYGIPQALPYSKMPRSAWPPADGGSASATAQISWGLSYIAQRYGTPEQAWAHEESAGWY